MTIYKNFKELSDKNDIIKKLDKINGLIDKFPQKKRKIERFIEIYDNLLDEAIDKQNKLSKTYEKINLYEQQIKEYREVLKEFGDIQRKTVELNDETSTLRGIYNSMYSENEQFKSMIRKLDDQKAFQEALKKKLEHDKELKVLIDKSLEEITVSNGMVTLSRGD